MRQQYMLMFSLGPVQPFIEQARKTRDLWIGSGLLSNIMKLVLQDIPKENIVYPIVLEPSGKKDYSNVPNKYVAIFDSVEDARKAATRSNERIEKYWIELCSKVYVTVLWSLRDKETDAIWARQTNYDALFEVYWVINPKSDEWSYDEWLDQTEMLLAARKRLRDFHRQDEPGEKSAISGQREVLRSASGIEKFWKKFAESREASDIQQDGHERLDAIDVVKRFAYLGSRDFRSSFPSTSSIATASFVESIVRKNISLDGWENNYPQQKNLVKSQDASAIPYLAKVMQAPEWLLQRDGDLYFPETFTVKRLGKDYGITDENKAKEIVQDGVKVLKALLQAADEQGVTRPTSYYSILKMDGDNMGMLLKGVRDGKEHRSVSEALSTFSSEDVQLVENQYPGRLVYAGGDDVLALAPLARDVDNAGPKHVLDLADSLQVLYRERLLGVLGEEAESERATASTGIVFAHHYTSLSYVLRMVRDAETIAKKQYGKNALVVTVLRRSGEQTRVGCKWRYPGIEDDEAQPIKVFSTFYGWLKQDILSPKSIHLLLQEAPVLVSLGRDAQKSEIRRVLWRQLDYKRMGAVDFAGVAEDKYKEKAKREVEHYAQYLVDIAEAMDETVSTDSAPLATELHSDQRRYGLVEVLGWLLVMAFLARKEQE